MIRIKRVYDPPEAGDGFRVLVDRLWPRGVAKHRARLDLWRKDVAPSDGLRKWFAHDPSKWTEFKARYRKELRADPRAVDDLRKEIAGKGRVTLLFGAGDERRNNAVVLLEALR